MQVSSDYWNTTTPTSSVFSVGTIGAMNNANGDYIIIAYCFRRCNKATQNLEATQVMEMLMEHLFIQDLNLLLL